MASREKNGGPRENEAKFSSDFSGAKAGPPDTLIDAKPRGARAERPKPDSLESVERQIAEAKAKLKEFKPTGKEQRGKKIIDSYAEPEAQALQGALDILRRKRDALKAPERQKSDEAFFRRMDERNREGHYKGSQEAGPPVIAPGSAESKRVAAEMKKLLENSAQSETEEAPTLDIQPPSLLKRLIGLFKK